MKATRLAQFGVRRATRPNGTGRGNAGPPAMGGPAFSAGGMAVAVGFEPTEGRTLTRFRGVLLRPLGHAAADEATRPVTADEIGSVAQPVGREELLEEVGALVREHTSDHLGSVVEPSV